MQGLPLAVGLSLVGSFAGLLIAAGLLLFPAEARGKLVPWLVSYAVGTLLGSSLLHLVPEALEQVPARQGVFALLAGILTFFVLGLTFWVGWTILTVQVEPEVDVAPPAAQTAPPQTSNSSR